MCQQACGFGQVRFGDAGFSHSFFDASISILDVQGLAFQFFFCNDCLQCKDQRLVRTSFRLKREAGNFIQ